MPKGKPTTKHIHFTEEQNALDYLQKAYEAIRRLPRDRSAWKWVVIGIHGALYGFAICAIKGTDWTRVAHPRTRKLIAFDEALKRCQSPQWTRQFTHSKPIHLTDEQKSAIRFLKHVRNQFGHYAPQAWSIEEHDLAVSAVDALDVIRSLARETGNVRLDASQRQSVDVSTRKGIQILQSSQLYKDYLAALKQRERS
jgi:hypothetical protein